MIDITRITPYLTLCPNTSRRLIAQKGILLTDHHDQPLLVLSDSLYLLKDGVTTKITAPKNLVHYGYVRQTP